MRSLNPKPVHTLILSYLHGGYQAYIGSKEINEILKQVEVDRRWNFTKHSSKSSRLYMLIRCNILELEAKYEQERLEFFA